MKTYLIALLGSLVITLIAKPSTKLDQENSCNSFLLKDYFGLNLLNQIVESGQMQEPPFIHSNSIAAIEYLSLLDTAFDQVSLSFSNWMAKSQNVVASNSNYIKARILIQDLRSNYDKISVLTLNLKRNLSYAKFSKWKRLMLKIRFLRVQDVDEITAELLSCVSAVRCLSNEIPIAMQDLKNLYGQLSADREKIKKFSEVVENTKSEMLQKTKHIPGAALKITDEFERLVTDIKLAQDVISNSMKAVQVDLDSLQVLMSGSQVAVSMLNVILAKDPNQQIATSIRILEGFQEPSKQSSSNNLQLNNPIAEPREKFITMLENIQKSYSQGLISEKNVFIHLAELIYSSEEDKISVSEWILLLDAIPKKSRLTGEDTFNLVNSQTIFFGSELLPASLNLVYLSLKFLKINTLDEKKYLNSTIPALKAWLSQEYTVNAKQNYKKVYHELRKQMLKRILKEISKLNIVLHDHSASTISKKNYFDGITSRQSVIKFNRALPSEFIFQSDASLAKVKITKPFEMMSTPITQKIWARLIILMGEKDLTKINPSYFKDGINGKVINLDNLQIQMRENHPVEMVSWNTVNDFIKRLNILSITKDVFIQNQLEAILPGHTLGDIYDLPTEAQWELVSQNRADNLNPQSDQIENNDITNYGWFSENSGQQTHPVASLQPRAYGEAAFYDLEGNVWEWTKDYFESSLIGGVDPAGPLAGYYRVVRGGSWGTAAQLVKTGGRNSFAPERGYSSVGFRLVRTR